jgi:SM-20-related protein
MLDIPVRIANCLATTGWYVGESIFPVELSKRLARRALALADAQMLRAARVGRSDGAQQHTQLRNDETRWLADTPEDASERDAVTTVQALRMHLNEVLFLGAQDAELHFARYAPGAFYRTHRDRFRDDDARVVSLVFYLNDDWPDDAGGELMLYADDDSGRIVARVPPHAGTMVCFLSDRFPHEVLPASRERYSLTGWLRRTATAPVHA